MTCHIKQQPQTKVCVTDEKIYNKASHNNSRIFLAEKLVEYISKVSGSDYKETKKQQENITCNIIQSEKS
jgi:hypothetical protein